jgi:hypothetical protein
MNMSHPPAARYMPLPSETFAAGIQLSTGVHRGVVPTVLAFHVPAHGADCEDVPTGMRDIARSLGLGPHQAPPPDIGRRIELRRGTPYLDYGHPDYALALPVGEEWRDVAGKGAPIRITILFEPFWPIGGPRAVAAHAQGCLSRGALQWGTTRL